MVQTSGVQGPDAPFLRDGTWQDLPARLLVPGDVVHLKLGNFVPADLDLIDGDYLGVDWSALTGESMPVDKKTGDTTPARGAGLEGNVDPRGEALGIGVSGRPTGSGPDLWSL